MEDQEKIIAKVKKLLSLAESSNQHEASSALEKANELLTRYNLTMQDVDVEESDYGTGEVWDGVEFHEYHEYTTAIINECFFVVCYMCFHATKVKPKAIKMFGTKTNCEIAAYSFDFLNSVFVDLAIKYSKKWGNEFNRKGFWAGLELGIVEQIKARQENVQQEQGLVLVKDPKLADFENNMSVNYRDDDESIFDSRYQDSMQAGYDEGLEVSLRPGITTNQNNPKLH